MGFLRELFDKKRSKSKSISKSNRVSPEAIIDDTNTDIARLKDIIKMDLGLNIEVIEAYVKELHISSTIDFINVLKSNKKALSRDPEHYCKLMPEVHAIPEVKAFFDSLR